MENGAEIWDLPGPKRSRGSGAGPGAGPIAIPGALESSGNKVLGMKGRAGNKEIKMTFDAMQRL